MKIEVKVGKQKEDTKEDKIIYEIEMDTFNNTKVEKGLLESLLKIKSYLNEIKDEDVFIVKTNLHINNKILLGGCQISGSIINHNKHIDILEMAHKQLIQQIKETLEGEKQ